MTDINKRRAPLRAILRPPERDEANTPTQSRATAAPGGDWCRRYRAWLRITDLIVIVCFVTVSALVRLRSEFGTAGGASTSASRVALLSVAVGVSWYVALSVYGTRDVRIVGVGVAEYKRVVAASAVAFGCLGIVFLLAGMTDTRGFFLIALPLGVIGLTGTRWLWRRWLARQRAFEHYVSRAIVAGRRRDVERIIAQIRTSSGAAYAILGAVVDDQTTGAITAGDRPVPILSNLDDIPRAARSVRADTVILVGQPRGGSEFIRTLSWQLEGTASDLVLAAPLTDVAGPRIRFRPVEGLPLIHVEIPQFEGGKHILKRGFDIVMSSVALVLLAPVMLAIAVAIKLDSPGPIFFSQPRVGRNEHTFEMFKFRSMTTGAEAELPTLAAKNEGSGPLFKLKDDPRVTALGKVLRRYSLDELPQFVNVLTGQMSLVGPRPPLPNEVSMYEAHVHRRLYIKPGLTGMWQIGGRSTLSWEESVRLDLYYVENWSLTGDVIILWRTFRTVLHPVGAY